ncbi:beta-phosphoglucomutase [soil metagenome]
MNLIHCIFDWDGVIIDSHDQHQRSWFLLAEEIGLPLSKEQFKATFGQRNASIIPLLGWAEATDEDRIAELGDRKEILYRQIIRQEGIEPLPGVRELLASLKAAKIPCAVGSSTPAANIETVMEIIGMTDEFEAIAAAEDVSAGKPAPDIFLVAAKKLRADPSECLVFEDAGVGLQAAAAAGMRAVALTTTHPAESLAPHRPALTVPDLSHVTLQTLLNLFL